MIFYFTGTGNSLYVAKELDEEIISIPQAIKQERLELAAGSIGIVCPIYGHEMPEQIKADIFCYGKNGRQGRSFFRFGAFEEPKSRDTDPNIILRFLRNLGRNIKATGLYFLFGVVLSAFFQRYVPADTMTAIFGGNEAFGVLMAATVGVPLYACGGGTIPLLQVWLNDGMSMGSAAAFMITGPATKITNLGALKIVLGAKNFILYLIYMMFFAFATGLLINIFV